MTLSRRLEKNFTWLLTPLVAVVVLLGTQGIAQIVGASLGQEPGALAADLRSGRAPRRPPPFHATSAAPIFAHNPFDSQLEPRILERDGEDPVASADPMDAPACDGLRVLAIVSSPDPEWSLAALEESSPPPAPARSLLRRRGGDVGERRVEFIAWDRVWMAGPAGRCQASMFAPRLDPEPDPARPFVAARPVLDPPGAPLEPWIVKGIETVSPTERNVDRGILPRLLEKQAELLKPAQASAEVVGGKVVGYRVTGVRPASLLGALGIVSGDRLQSINGYELTDAGSAIEAYAHLLQASRLVVQLNRGGSDVRLEINIR